MREHNFVVENLAREYPWMDDEELYQRGRLILAAEISVVHTRDGFSVANEYMVNQLGKDSTGHSLLFAKKASCDCYKNGR